MKTRKRNRMQGFDYSSDNLYFVTICVQDRKCCLGNVIPAGTGRDLSAQNVLNMTSHSKTTNIQSAQQNEIGISNTKISNDLSAQNVLDITSHFDTIEEDKFTMQLNENGVIVFNQLEWLATQYEYVDVHNFVVMPNHVHAIIEIDSSRVNQKEVKIKSLSSLIGAFKTTSSKQIHLKGYAEFAWQRSFHDHIIRDERAYHNISNYIDNNPKKWAVDTFFEKASK